MFRKMFLVFFAFSFCSISYSQNLPDFESIKLEKKEDYTPEADNAALSASNYLLSAPYDRKDPAIASAASYVLRWMNGSPTYHFTLDEMATRVSKNNSDLFVLYLAAMVKFALSNMEQAKDEKLVKLNTVKTLLAYCTNPSNRIKMKGELKKLYEADKEGTLGEYLSN